MGKSVKSLYVEHIINVCFILLYLDMKGILSYLPEFRDLPSSPVNGNRITTSSYIIAQRRIPGENSQGNSARTMSGVA